MLWQKLLGPFFEIYYVSILQLLISTETLRYSLDLFLHLERIKKDLNDGLMMTLIHFFEFQIERFFSCFVALYLGQSIQEWTKQNL